MHEQLQLPCLDLLLQMVALGSTVLGCIPPILMILAVETLITLGGVSPHFVGPLEIRLIFNFFQDPVYGLLEHQADHLGIGLRWLANKISP